MAPLELHRKAVAFDLEWVPDTALIREYYGLETAGEVELQTGAPLKLAFHRIVAAALVDVHDMTRTATHVAQDLDGEVALIQAALIPARRGSQLLSYGGHAYDWPLLVQRALSLGVSVADIDRIYWHPYGGRHVDLAALVSGPKGMKGAWLSLDELSMVALGERKIASGAGVAGMIADGRYDEVGWYCLDDTLKVARLARLLVGVPALRPAFNDCLADTPTP